MSKITDTLSSSKFMILVTFLGLYLLSTGISLAVFSYMGGSGVSINLSDLMGARSKIADLPKTEECPINGGMFTQVERDIWEGRRPATVIVENHTDARPLSGMSKADVVYEAVAEGGITRFLGVFYCDASSVDLKVGIVRSARVYFINWAAEYGNDPIFLHWGGANNLCGHCPGGVKPKSQIAPKVDAYALLEKIGWRQGAYGNDFDGGTNIGFPVVRREKNRLGDRDASAEHTPVVIMDELYKAAEERGYGYKDEEGLAWDDGFDNWSFADDSPLSSAKAGNISIEFWRNKPDYDVEWKYDPANNAYLRFNGGKEFVDWEFENEQIASKNVVVMFTKETGPVDEETHMYYETTGTGKVLIFQNGDVIKGTWKKKSVDSRTEFIDGDGNEISFVRGPIWIAVVANGSEIDY